MVAFRVREGADFGSAIAELRAQRAMSQSELADLVGLTSDYVSKIESGRTSSVLEHQLRALRRLGATISIEWPDE